MSERIKYRPAARNVCLTADWMEPSFSLPTEILRQLYAQDIEDMAEDAGLVLQYPINNNYADE